MKCTLLWILILTHSLLLAQSGNPNLADPGSGCLVDSSSSNFPMAYKVITGNTEEGWNTSGETAGAWITLRFEKPVVVSEVWILSRPIFSYNITPYNTQYRYEYAPAKDITLTFSDGSKEDLVLGESANFQIVPLPRARTTSSLKLAVRTTWPDAGTSGTGIGKIRIIAHPNPVSATVRPMENYNGIDGRPVKLAYLTVTNPGTHLTDVHARISQHGTTMDDIAVGTIAAHAVTEKELWTFIPERDGEFDFQLLHNGMPITTGTRIPITAYRKTYFDGGKVLIHSTNHNDLGWLGTQFETADYRSKTIILPALKIMEENPQYCYTMEAVAYLNEFLARHPEKREEISRFIREGRFSWGASYTLLLQEQVGPEKLARQFYFGRRWLKENIPGADSRIFINADVPMLTWQLPQILQSAGVRYLSQARIPLGFYYWQGLDGTSIPVYGLRYGNSPKLSPRANDEWLKLVYGREDFHREHNLPNIMIYDYNEDYLPPNPEYLPFVKEQNLMSRNFAAAWNLQHTFTPEQQTHPPVLQFTNPEEMLNQVFQAPGIHLETMKGEWPNAWAYYDEPGNREALLNGRKAHNTLLSAEKLFSFLKMVDPAVAYPKCAFDSAWRANCWPDHGWGGGKGLITDSIYHASYETSRIIADSLLRQAADLLVGRTRSDNSSHISVVIYNSLNWPRRELVTASFVRPHDWSGFALNDPAHASIPFEVTGMHADTTTILFNAEVPGSGLAVYHIEPSRKTHAPVASLVGDTIDNADVRIVFGNAGIKEYSDKKKRRQYFRTDKFQAGEVLEFSAPGNAWDDGESLLKVNMIDFDRSGNHRSSTTRFAESPVRYIRETETSLNDCTLLQRYSISKATHDIALDAEIKNWNGTKGRELRIAFPMNIEHKVVSGLSTVPPSCLKTPDGKHQGLLGEYFANPNVSGAPVFRRVDSNMAPYWDKSSPGNGIPNDFFSVRWTGTISVPETGDYVLGIITDDKGRLYFEDNLVADNWNPYELNVMKTIRARMEKGREYRVRIEYAEIVEYAGIRFQWRMEDTAGDVKTSAAISYEIPFGAVDFGKDEVDFSRFPDNKESQFYPHMYGGIDKLPFREAVNWVNVSTGTYKGYGCLFASDMTVHLFEDQTSSPVSYPVVQHVLLSTRKSLAWDSEYWFDQRGNHSYRMAMLFHDGNWRQRYREGIAFNYPLIVSTSYGHGTRSGQVLTASNVGFLRTEPSNIVITTVKQSEDGKGMVVRFYEAEGNSTTARFTSMKPFKEVFRTDLLEYDPVKLPLESDGSIRVPVRPWEIVTLLIE
jgi:hypothetical protein